MLSSKHFKALARHAKQHAALATTLYSRFTRYLQQFFLEGKILFSCRSRLAVQVLHLVSLAFLVLRRVSSKFLQSVSCISCASCVLRPPSTNFAVSCFAKVVVCARLISDPRLVALLAFVYSLLW